MTVAPILTATTAASTLTLTPGIALNPVQIQEKLGQLQLASGAQNSKTVDIGGIDVTFSNTPHTSAGLNTVARTVGVSYVDPTTSHEYEAQLTVVLSRTDNSVNVQIIPLVHPTLRTPLSFSIMDPQEPPPPPDFTFGAGWFGWSGSFSESEVQQILAAYTSPVGVAVRSAISAIVGHINWIAGIIVTFVLAIGNFLLKLIDDAGKDKGLCFVDTWPGIWWVQPGTAAPWGFH